MTGSSAVAMAHPRLLAPYQSPHSIFFGSSHRCTPAFPAPFSNSSCCHRSPSAWLLASEVEDSLSPPRRHRCFHMCWCLRICICVCVCACLSLCCVSVGVCRPTCTGLPPFPPPVSLRVPLHLVKMPPAAPPSLEFMNSLSACGPTRAAAGEPVGGRRRVRLGCCVRVTATGAMRLTF